MQAPNNIEEAITALEELFNRHGQIDNIPYEDAVIPTHRLFWDLLNRIILIETKLETIQKKANKQ